MDQKEFLEAFAGVAKRFSIKSGGWIRAGSNYTNERCPLCVVANKLFPKLPRLHLEVYSAAARLGMNGELARRIATAADYPNRESALRAEMLEMIRNSRPRV